MGIGGASIMDIGRKGMMASRAGVSTASHNISNVNTEGASRQRADIQASNATPAGRYVFGSGSEVGTVRRINDEYLTRNIHAENRKSGNYEEKDFQLMRVEEVFNESIAQGMSSSVSRLFNDFRKLSLEPENNALRQTLKESAQAIVQEFRGTYGNLKKLSDGVDARLEGYIKEVNSLAGQVASLNKQIQEMEVRSGAPNDLLDKRELILGKLSEMSGATYQLGDNGQYIVSLGGYNLVYTDRVNTVSMARSGEGVRIMMESNPQPDITDRVNGGKLGGLVEYRRDVLDPTMNKLNLIAHTLVREVNFVHRQGFGLDGKTARDFFSSDGTVENAASSIDLSDDVRKDGIAIAAALEKGSAGDNRLALMLANLENEKFMDSSTKTIGDFYNSMVSSNAVVIGKNRQLKEHQDIVNSQLKEMRESISGISMDEETMNLVKFQHSLDASAKVIKVADEIFETVLGLRR